MKKKRVFGIMVMLVTIALAIGYYKMAQPLYKTEKSGDEPRGHKEPGENHEGHEEKKPINLGRAELEEYGIEVAEASSGMIELTVDLPGVIALNADKLAHVVPRIPGVVREVRKNLGDAVTAGEAMAVIDSRDLADSKAEYLAGGERVALARANFEREQKLWRDKISSEQEYLDAKKALAEAQIGLRSAEQKLHAMGFSERHLKELPNHPDDSFTRYIISAPLSGTVVEKHIAMGESLREDADIFMVADLSSVWVDISVYQKDLASIRKGQKVLIEIDRAVPPREGIISYIGPLVGEKSRTALARVVLPNGYGDLRPGMFINAGITVDRVQARVVIPKTALQTMEDQSVVFVQTEEGFVPRPVKMGSQNTHLVEVVQGLDPGTRYVSRGGFILKAQILKGALGDGHGH